MSRPAEAPTAPHHLVARAARGSLPTWARAGVARRQHMERVAALLDAWASALGLPDSQRQRWRALGHLHDCLKDAPEAELRGWVEAGLADLPAPVLHGPAAAARLAAEGVKDAELLDAIRFHTLGHVRLARAGRALYAADFLEPGRKLREEWRRQLRARMPGELDAVVREIVQGRILHLVEAGRPVRHETVGLWNSLARR